MEKQVFKIVLNHDGKGQEKCLNLFSKTSQKSKLVTFALLEMIEKYGLDNIDESELKEFIKGYKALSRIKERNFTFSERPETSNNKTEPPVENKAKEKKEPVKRISEPPKPTPPKAEDTTSATLDQVFKGEPEDEMDINPDAFAQMLSIMSAV